MLNNLAVAAILTATIGLTGCASIGQAGKSLQNEFGSGLTRRVTFYSYDGKVLKTWEGKIFTEGNEGESLHFQVDGKRMTVSGAYTIEEI